MAFLPRVLLALLLPCLPACAAPAATPAPPLREEEPFIVRIFAVGDITKRIEGAEGRLWWEGGGCVFYYEYPEAPAPDPDAVEPDVLLDWLRFRTGGGSGESGGPVVVMQGSATVLAVGPPRLMEELDVALRCLRESRRLRIGPEGDGARGEGGASGSGGAGDP